MKIKLQTPVIFFLILSLFIFACSPLNQALATPANPDASPVAAGTESSNAQPQLSDIISSDNAKNLVEISSWGKGSGHHPTYSPDGGLIAVSSSSGIYLYDSQTLQENMRIEASSYDVLEMAFSPDGKILSAIAGTYGDITVIQCDLASGSELHSWSADLTYNNDVNIVSLSADGRTVAVLTGTYEDGTVKLLDVASGQELHSLSVFYAEILTLSPDGKTLAVANYEGVALWDVTSGDQLRTIVTSSDLSNPAVISLTFSPDGKTLATGSEPASAGNTKRGTVQLWDVASGNRLDGFSEDIADVVTLLIFSQDGERLAGGSADAIKLWDVANGNELLSINASNLERLAFSPDGKTLVSASSIGDDSVKLWDAATGDLLFTLKGDDVGGNVIWSADSGTLAYESATGFSVGLRDLASGAIRSLSGHPYYVESIAFSPDGKMLASASMWNAMVAPDNLLKLWDVASGQELHILNGHRSTVGNVAFSPDGMMLASASWDETIKLWDVASGSELRTLSGNTGLGYSVAFSPDGKLLASAFNDEAGDVVKLWDVTSGSELRTLSVNTDQGLRLSFSPDGKVLVSSNYWGYGGLWQLWDVATGQELPAFSENIDTQRSFAFSPDGGTLAIGFEDGTVKLLDVASGQELYTLSGHTKAVRTLAFSSDGNLLISGGGDHIKLWDAASGDELASLSVVDVYRLSLSPNGKLMLVRSFRGLSLWGVSP